VFIPFRYQTLLFALLVIISVYLLGPVIANLIPIANADEPLSTENLRLELSDEAQDAIVNGVTLSFSCQFAVRKTFWFLSRSSKLKTHQFLIKRHLLSNRYVVTRDDLDTPHIFNSITEATNYVAAQTVMLLEFYHNSNNPYSMRLSLNRFDLPAPLRLTAFISKAWDIDTGWIAWQ